jgi:riboflavin synthase
VFTGLVEEKGRVLSVSRLPGDAAIITIGAAVVLDETNLGDSIAVNGVCLTVAEHGPQQFSAEVMSETLTRTTTGDLNVAAEVNLERAVLATSRLGGHVVQGHVDGVGELIEIEPAEHWTKLTFEIPQALAGYVAEKGSIAINGVSLTIVAVSAPKPEARDALAAKTVVEHDTAHSHWFQVSLIPTTQDETTLGSIAVGDRVNLEVDVIAKYVERLMAVSQS